MNTKQKMEVMQAYLDGRPIEVNLGDGWELWLPLSEPIWTWGTNEYRIAKTPDSIDWNHVAERFKYMARDKDGRVYLYTHKPWAGNSGWASNMTYSGVIYADVYSSLKVGDVDWQDSLVERG